MEKFLYDSFLAIKLPSVMRGESCDVIEVDGEMLRVLHLPVICFLHVNEVLQLTLISLLSSLFIFLRDFLGWAVLLNFLVYITVPVVLYYTGILLGIGSFAIYINTIIGLAKKENYFWEQVNFIDFIANSGILNSMEMRSVGFRPLGLAISIKFRI
jgi:hypothetical protein